MIVEERFHPFRWWWLEDCLRGEELGWLMRQQADPIALNGKREAKNSERTFITTGPIARWYEDQIRKKWFENLTGVSFKDARTRIELCNDYATEIQFVFVHL